MSQRQLIRVREVMKPQFDLIDGMTTVADALRTMQHVETKALIVDKRHENDEYGMVLISDIARHVLAKDRAPERVNVYEIMAKPVISVDPEMDIRYCARLFERFELSRAPVLEQGRVIGIVSFTDMVLRGLCRNIDQG
ncbi:CBS domain-containing protein [Thiohalobacter sp. IOR34]|uniref:CBS domain-containing protein n=1 Tax=Thiohalobacter sp. IOR34 TaxID=3057176 RepID=UPI0025AFD695|nr:CBS domain-containing protein [Thiohalobacter sp. IOR34]WJW75074.1 CBS domain-containing protein [Thiohalobacter sp. IOR34]